MTQLAQQTVVAADFYPDVRRSRKVQTTKFIAAFDLGAMDARRGELCLPTLYFATRVQMRDYAKGHESVVGRTLLSSQILGRKGGK